MRLDGAVLVWGRSEQLLLQSSAFGSIVTVVVSFHLLLQLFHFFGLSLPLAFAHLALPAEQLVVRPTVAAAHPVPKRCELAVVVIKVQMVHCVAGGPVNYIRI